MVVVVVVVVVLLSSPVSPISLHVALYRDTYGKKQLATSINKNENNHRLSIAAVLVGPQEYSQHLQRTTKETKHV